MTLSADLVVPRQFWGKSMPQSGHPSVDISQGESHTRLYTSQQLPPNDPSLLPALHGPLVNPRRALSHQLAAPANPYPHAWDLRSARFGSPLSVHDRYLYLNIVLRAWERKPRSRSTRESSVLVEHTGMTTTLRRASARLRTFTATRPFCYACAIRFKRRLITPRPSVVTRRHGRRVNVDTLRGNAGDSPVRRSVRIHLRRTRTTLRRGRVRGVRWIRADAGE